MAGHSCTAAFDAQLEAFEEPGGVQASQLLDKVGAVGHEHAAREVGDVDAIGKGIERGGSGGWGRQAGRGAIEELAVDGVGREVQLGIGEVAYAEALPLGVVPLDQLLHRRPFRYLGRIDAYFHCSINRVNS